MNQNDRLTEVRKLRVSNKCCPQCNTKTINWDTRKCHKCGLRVYKLEDYVGINKSLSEAEYFYIWGYSAEYQMYMWAPMEHFNLEFNLDARDAEGNPINH